MLLGLLVAAALLAGIVGFSLLSNATLGVGVIALGCLAGILARLVQAAQHHKEMMYALGYNASVAAKHQPDSPACAQPTGGVALEGKVPRQC